jgi:hypothetical protein
MRQHVVTVAAAAIAATATSFAVAQADRPTAQDSQSQRAVVRELKKLNRAIGSSEFTGLRSQIEKVRRQNHSDLADTCRALGGDPITCPDFSLSP